MLDPLFEGSLWLFFWVRDHRAVWLYRNTIRLSGIEHAPVSFLATKLHVFDIPPIPSHEPIHLQEIHIALGFFGSSDFLSSQ